PCHHCCSGRTSLLLHPFLSSTSHGQQTAPAGTRHRHHIACSSQVPTFLQDPPNPHTCWMSHQHQHGQLLHQPTWLPHKTWPHHHWCRNLVPYVLPCSDRLHPCYSCIPLLLSPVVSAPFMGLRFVLMF